MARIDFEDKKSLKISPLPRKNTLTSEDINEIKNSVNALYDEKQDNLIVLTQAEFEALNPVDENQFYFIVG
jgi:hypothetical protein